MDEDVFAIFALDKAKTFSRVKPLYGSCFFHVSSIPMISGFLSYRFEYYAEATLDLTALRKKPAGSVIHAAFSKATNSVLVAASRWAFSRRYLRFLYPRPRLSRVLIFPLIASTTPSGTFVSQ